MKKYLVLPAAMLIHLCLGGIYAWSVFVPVLRSDFGYTAAQTQFVFGFTIAMLCVCSIFGGRLQDLLGPRVPAVLGGLLTGAGYLTAGFFGDRFWGLLLGIGVLCGLGVGFGYLASMAAAAKWFPSRKGLVTGLVVAGYGSAGIILSTVVGILLAHDWSVLRVFKAVGLVYGSVIVITALTLSVPAGSAKWTGAHEFRPLALLRDIKFWVLAIGIACATYPGLALIGALKPIGTWHGYDTLTATASISALAVGNGAGRILWGLIHDHVRRGMAVPLLMTAIVASVLLFAAGGHGRILFLVSTFFLGFCYGGSLAVFPSEVAETYGIHVIGSVYPFVLLFHGIAAIIAAPLTGLGVDATESYWPGIALALGAALIGLAVCTILPRRGKLETRN